MSSLADQFVPVRQLCGLGGIPTCRRNAGQWLRRRGIPTVTIPSSGGPAEAVDPADLPPEVRAALAAERAAAAGLPAGEYCPELDRRYLEASLNLRAEADRKVRMAHILAHGRAAGLSARARYAEVRKEFGDEKGTKDAALRAIEMRIEGVAPANYAGALVRDQKGGAAPADCDPRAWEMLKGDFLRKEKPAFSACYTSALNQ